MSSEKLPIEQEIEEELNTFNEKLETESKQIDYKCYVCGRANTALPGTEKYHLCVETNISFADLTSSGCNTWNKIDNLTEGVAEETETDDMLQCWNCRTVGPISPSLEVTNSCAKCNVINIISEKRKAEDGAYKGAWLDKPEDEDGYALPHLETFCPACNTISKIANGVINFKCRNCSSIRWRCLDTKVLGAYLTLSAAPTVKNPEEDISPEAYEAYEDLIRSIKFPQVKEPFFEDSVSPREGAVALARLEETKASEEAAVEFISSLTAEERIRFLISQIVKNSADFYELKTEIGTVEDGSGALEFKVKGELNVSY